MAIAEIIDLWKTYEMGTEKVHALKGVSLSFREGDYVSIVGSSGSGKSTMLNMLGCLDRPTRGTYLLGGDDVSTMDDDELSEIRSRRLGFIFQSYNLIQQLTVLENIEVPLLYQGWSEKQSSGVAEEMATSVGLGGRLGHRPFELSGGQQQRVGIARALVCDPLILLADEPTGNLDSKTGSEILALFDKLNEQGKTIIIVTHDNAIAQHAARVVRMQDGEIIEDTRKAPGPADVSASSSGG